MNKVYVRGNPLYEKVICAHTTEDATCNLCDEAQKTIEDTHYFLQGKWLSIDTGDKLCYCGNPVDLLNPDCVEYNLCKEHSIDV